MKKLLQGLMWRLNLPLLLLNAWCLLIIFGYLRTPITILIVGAVLAFLLDHPLRWLERHRITRALAIVIVLLSALLLLGILGVIIFPLLAKQANQLSDSLSHWAVSAQMQAEILRSWAVSRGIPIDTSAITSSIGARLSLQIQSMLDRIPSLITGAVGGAFELILIIVVTLYLLIQGETLWNGLLEWLPHKLSVKVRTSLPQRFRNYFVGQGTVALMLGSFMTIAFLIAHIPFGFLFGVFIGLMALFPFGGGISITIVTLLVALKSIWLGVLVVAIGVIVDQVVENGIAPRLLGKLTGVHPVWVVMMLLIGSKIAGILGVLLAVPLASFVKDVMDDYKPKPIVSQD